MKRLAILTLLTGALFAADVKVGVVNFGNCISDSKVGKQEQSNFEALNKQMSTLVEDTQKQLREMSDKFNDKDYLDGLSPEGEEELKTKFRKLSEELEQYRNQYYQVLNQANFKMVQNMQGHINQAAEKVASAKKLEVIGNKEAFFYFLPSLDVTADVIKEMDKSFEVETKKQGATAVAPPVEKAEAKK